MRVRPGAATSPRTRPFAHAGPIPDESGRSDSGIFLGARRSPWRPSPNSSWSRFQGCRLSANERRGHDPAAGGRWDRAMAGIRQRKDGRPISAETCDGSRVVDGGCVDPNAPRGSTAPRVRARRRAHGSDASIASWERVLVNAPGFEPVITTLPTSTCRLGDRGEGARTRCRTPSASRPARTSTTRWGYLFSRGALDEAVKSSRRRSRSRRRIRSATSTRAHLSDAL